MSTTSILNLDVMYVGHKRLISQFNPINNKFHIGESLFKSIKNKQEM